MSEKVKVNDNIAKLIGRYDWYESDLTAIEHIINEKEYTHDDKVLAIKGFLNGFEVEQTSEEKALNYYNSLKNSVMESNKHLASSIRHFLILAEIEFKGVTDTEDAIDDLVYNELF